MNVSYKSLQSWSFCAYSVHNHGNKTLVMIEYKHYNALIKFCVESLPFVCLSTDVFCIYRHSCVLFYNFWPEFTSFIKCSPKNFCKSQLPPLFKPASNLKLNEYKISCLPQHKNSYVYNKNNASLTTLITIALHVLCQPTLFFNCLNNQPSYEP